MAPKKKLQKKINKKTVAAKVKKILPILKETYPDAKIALNFSNPLELLIATILSAQCTDVRVNIVTGTLFKKYRCAKDWVKTDIKEIQEDIRSTGFYRNKAKNIKSACETIIAEFSGQVPQGMDELISLAGVGRKTANVVRGNVFGKPGITCDTHVIRLSRRIGLSGNSDPVKLEFDLAEIIDKKDWTLFSHLLIFHGRNICKARKPDCKVCPIAKYCEAFKNPDLM